MKLALNKKGKVVVIAKKGKRQTIKKKLTSYERYLVKAKELNVDYILTEGEYYATVRFNREKGRKVNHEILARWQFQGDNTDKQIKAMWNAAKLQNPDMTRAQFIRDKGWENINQQASNLYAKIKAENPEMTSKDISRIISQQIYGSN